VLNRAVEKGLAFEGAFALALGLSLLLIIVVLIRAT
jgi:hypothetical protein